MKEGLEADSNPELLETCGDSLHTNPFDFRQYGQAA
jgi:hypothetical protein